MTEKSKPFLRTEFIHLEEEKLCEIEITSLTTGKSAKVTILSEEAEEIIEKLGLK